MIFGNPARRPYCGRINRVPVVKYSSLHTSCHISFPNSATSSSGHDLPSGSFVDHTRPDLFYHLSEPPTPLSPDAPVYALSFLPSASPVSNSATIIGWLPASTERQTEQDAGLNDFKENIKFRHLLHEAVKSGLQANVDEIQRNGALQIQQGWMHIHGVYFTNDRNIPALGRIGDPDDIIASVLVEDGKIQADTYQAMPAYRLCTTDGVTQLTEGLSAHLHKILLQRLEIERKGQSI
ncbi:hypothetical protein C8R41DRAFT_768434 [Lentinula lateritia]|uniref:Carbonic anhydrase n=1 Tax=Lentinula lateritia TaxID=40482 RepID=A0ABQ8VC16_9AGAR|nr:hypothetical protein C8R41DRAFT_768434 [Lentinula lateritia]